MSTAMVISRRGRRSICATSWTYITAVPSNIPSATDVLSLESILNPIERGIFWFNGFLSLKPFIAFQPARLSHDERTSYLRALGERLQHIEGEQPRTGDDGGSG
jgi:hypothetical protein